jgi:hypothetical protein
MKRLNLCGEHIRDLRMSQGLTSDQMQSRLREYGLDLDLAEIEAGRCEITDVALVILAQVFAVPLEHVLFGKAAFPDKSQLREMLLSLE